MAVTERAVFVDKDGTLVEDVPYNADPDRVVLVPGAAEALRGLRDAGYRIVVVSNQSGVARGHFPESALRDVEARVRYLLAREGVIVDAFVFCPHHPEGTVDRYRVSCQCRKPKPGLLTRAAEEFGLDLASSWMVGDILDDVEAGHRAGCRSVLLDNGHETEWVLTPERRPEKRVSDLPAAARTILARDAARVAERVG